MSKNILVLASTFPRWKNDTTPSFVYNLEKRLSDKFNIDVLVPHFKGAKKKEIEGNLKIHRFRYFWPEEWQKLCYGGGILPNLRKNKLLWIQGFTLIICEFFSAIRIIKKNGTELIHAHWIIPQGIVAFILKKFFKIPYIITVHGSDIFGLKNSFLTKAKKNILINADYITAVSNAIKDEIIRIINTNKNISVVPMGVDLSLFNPDKYDETIKKNHQIKGPLLLFVGRLEDIKGIKYLIKSMLKIIKKSPNAKLLIIGEGPIKKNLEELINNLKLNKSVLLIGALSHEELPKYYSTSDFFISPSIKTKSGHVEGFGLTLVEASLSGSLIIGTKTGGIQDIIEDKKTGFLVEENNSESIADKVIQLLKNKSLYKKVKSNGRNINLKKFSWENSVSSFSKIYNQIN